LKRASNASASRACSAVTAASPPPDAARRADKYFSAGAVVNKPTGMPPESSIPASSNTACAKPTGFS
jgi:hypothetical protein